MHAFALPPQPALTSLWPEADSTAHVPPPATVLPCPAAGESVANLADVVGTVFGIALAKANLPVVPTFAALSVGYLISSRWVLQ